MMNSVKVREKRASSLGDKDQAVIVNLLPITNPEENQRKNPLSNSTPEKQVSKRHSNDEVKTRRSEPKPESPRIEELKRSSFVKPKKRHSHSPDEGTSLESIQLHTTSEPKDMNKSDSKTRLKSKKRDNNSQSLSPETQLAHHFGRTKDTLDGAMEERKRLKTPKNQRVKKETPDDKPRHQHPISDFYVLSSKAIGQGSFSKVFVGLSIQTNERVAIKVVKKLLGDQTHQEMIKNESNILLQMDHPNIIKCYDLFENDDAVFIVMELATGGELFERIVKKDSYSEADAIKVMGQLFSAVGYLHSKDIVHRDLKPENLLLQNKNDVGPIKVSDFGLSTIYNKEMMSNVCGSPGYVAPEVLNGTGYGPAVDVWSCGVILYILLCGYPPFYNEYQNLLFESILNCEYKFHSPYWDEISPDAKDLISKCLVSDPTQRITAAGALKHPWQKLVNDSSLFNSIAAPLPSIMKCRLAETAQRNLSARKTLNNKTFTKTL